MKIKSGVVQIDTFEDGYLVTANLHGMASALGSYKSSQEAVESCLPQSDDIPIVSTALKAIQTKGEELGWDETRLSEVFQ